MPLLRVERLSKAFGGVKAVDAVSLCLEDGEIRALIGPNGSGKTTSLNLLSGLYAADSGRIELLGEEITHLQPYARVERGVARTFQMVRLFPSLTVVQNVLTGLHCRTRSVWPWMKRACPRIDKEARVRELLAFVGLPSRGSVLAGMLTHGEKRFLEIARALASEPRLLLLDEPSAGMTQQETEHFLQILQAIHGQGIAILMVEHNMHLVMKVAQRISVLNFGCKIAEGPPAQIQCDPQVIDAYLGEG